MHARKRAGTHAHVCEMVESVGGTHLYLFGALPLALPRGRSAAARAVGELRERPAEVQHRNRPVFPPHRDDAGLLMHAPHAVDGRRVRDGAGLKLGGFGHILVAVGLVAHVVVGVLLRLQAQQAHATSACMLSKPSRTYSSAGCQVSPLHGCIAIVRDARGLTGGTGSA